MTRLFFAHAAISLIPVVVLSTVLILTSSRDARSQARADGALDAGTVAQSAVEPILTGHHQGVGLWWFYELAGAAVLIALSLRAVPRRAGSEGRRRPRP